MKSIDVSSLLLEKANRSDLANLIEESKRAFLPSAANPDETSQDLFDYFEDQFNRGEDQIYQPLGYKFDNEWISYIVALHYKGNIISIGPMFVSDRYRGLGLGNKQVVDFIDYAIRKGFESVYTKTWEKNEASQSIFQHNGFRIIGSKPNDRLNGDSTIKYLLDL